MKSKLNERVRHLARPVDSVVKSSDTVAQALASLHGKRIDHKVIYFYVVDEEDTLIGIAPTRKLLLCSRDELISDIMDPSVIRLIENQTLSEGMKLFAEYNLLALPVVTNKGKLLGAIDVGMYMEESFDIADANLRQDIFQLIGVSIEEEKKKTVFEDYKIRMPWIFCNMFGGVLCAIISHAHEEVLAKVLILAMFIPLVLTLSESISMQAMIHSLHFLRIPRISIKKILTKSFKEIKVIAMMAVSYAILVGLISLFFKEGLEPAMIICFGIMISIVVSSAFGIAIPVFLHKTRLDPKVASGPIVLMLADVITTFLYFSLAHFWLW